MVTFSDILKGNEILLQDTMETLKQLINNNEKIIR
jgi:hypothetical protein